MGTIEIERVKNGYVLKDAHEKTIHSTLESLFRSLLLKYEGRASTFTGNSFGDVVVRRKQP